jgi:succinate-semialdehyde dehydrogenase/glutarate-semialdehyde dehydrogenase
MGKPLAESKIEMQVAIDLLRWYGEEGKRIYGRIIPSRFPACSMRRAKCQLDQPWPLLPGIFRQQM